MCVTCSLIMSCCSIPSVLCGIPSLLIPGCICILEIPAALLVCLFWSVMGCVLGLSTVALSMGVLSIIGCTQAAGCMAQIITTPVGVCIMFLGWLIESCIGCICGPIGKLYNLICGGW